MPWTPPESPEGKGLPAAAVRIPPDVVNTRTALEL